MLRLNRWIVQIIVGVLRCVRVFWLLIVGVNECVYKIISAKVSNIPLRRFIIIIISNVICYLVRSWWKTRNKLRSPGDWQNIRNLTNLFVVWLKAEIESILSLVTDYIEFSILDRRGVWREVSFRCDERKGIYLQVSASHCLTTSLGSTISDRCCSMVNKNRSALSVTFT